MQRKSRCLSWFEVSIALKVRYATKYNCVLFIADRNFSEVFPRVDPFSKKGRRRDSLKMLDATKTQRFEVVRIRNPFWSAWEVKTIFVCERHWTNLRVSIDVTSALKGWPIQRFWQVPIIPTWCHKQACEGPTQTCWPVISINRLKNTKLGFSLRFGD